MAHLSKEEAVQLRRGFCPHCMNAVMMPGPRGPESRTMLCSVCLREYSISLASAEVLHDICPPVRLREVYGLKVTAEMDEGKEFP